MIRLLITGANSFVGESVEKHLKNHPEDYQIDTLDMRGERWRDADFCGFDSVLHVAGIAHVRANPRLTPLYEAVNRDLAVQTAKKARESGVKQFVFMSSMIVYGNAAPVGKRRSIGQNEPECPATADGRSKLEAERELLRLSNAEFHVAVLRPPMIYGPGCKGNYTTLARYARRFCLFPNFPNRRSALYIENFAEFVRQLLQSGEGGVFFPRNAQTVSTTDFMREISIAHGKKMYFPRCFNPLLQWMGRLNPIRRAFGDMVYGSDVPDWPGNYQVCDFSQSIQRTERNAKGANAV